MKVEADEKLAQKYGSYASFNTAVDPHLIETWGESPIDEVDRLIKKFCHSETTMLDLGCGAGQTLCRYAPSVKQMVGFEQVTELFEATKQRVAALDLANVQLVQGNVAQDEDVHQLPDDTFDLVLSRRGPDVTKALLGKLKRDAIVIQELAREALGLQELFGRKPFLPQAGNNPHWLLEPYRWLGLLPISIKDYFYVQYFESPERFAAYLKHAGLLGHWRMPKIVFDPELDQEALALYVRYNQTEKGIRLLCRRTVYLFRRTAVSHYPAIPTAEPLYPG
ncbi:MAG: class I SAM-dependent methyltransferase [Chloroflexota bacterium]